MHCCFDLKSSEDLVVFNGVVQTVGHAYLEKFKIDPGAKIAYHKVNDMSADLPGSFVITQTHQIAFVVSDTSSEGSKTCPASTFAIHAPLEQWNTKVSAMLWQVKWTNKGLTPIKPAVYSLMEIELLPGRCLILK